MAIDSSASVNDELPQNIPALNIFVILPNGFWSLETQSKHKIFEMIICDFVVSTVLLGHPQEQWWLDVDPLHWHENVVIPTKLFSLAVLKFVILTICN